MFIGSASQTPARLVLEPNGSWDTFTARTTRGGSWQRVGSPPAPPPSKRKKAWEQRWATIPSGPCLLLRGAACSGQPRPLAAGQVDQHEPRLQSGVRQVAQGRWCTAGGARRVVHGIHTAGWNRIRQARDDALSPLPSFTTVSRRCTHLDALHAAARLLPPERDLNHKDGICGARGAKRRRGFTCSRAAMQRPHRQHAQQYCIPPAERAAPSLLRLLHLLFQHPRSLARTPSASQGPHGCQARTQHAPGTHSREREERALPSVRSVLRRKEALSSLRCAGQAAGTATWRLGKCQDRRNSTPGLRLPSTACAG